ncbi:hypothetical protein FACS189444_1900 [Spirochaetia bacterium]|nr:hypothetical protein FACS189444_1900 [Spirochaetia bacterium]
MAKGNFLYILRFAVDPGYGEDETLQGVLDFCQQGDIDDVMFFGAGEELSTGHLTLKQQQTYAHFFRKAKAAVENLGVSFSINIWSTFYHTDRGRALAEGQNFQTMVDPNGKKASVAVCPLCPEFRAYYLDLAKRFAALDPFIFWIEDDFRFHNHGPLHWGGCFCERHMEEFSKKAGKTVTREEFVAGILRTGEPHPYRKIWLDSCRDTFNDIAAEIGNTMRAVSPGIRIGLMSSVPQVHCAEGRDWEGILGGFAGPAPKTNRIHLPAYWEQAPQSYFWGFNTVSMLSRASVPKDTEIFPELENIPYGLATKSLNFIRFQISSALAMNIQGITMNIFDFLGSGVRKSEGHGENLKSLKPFLESCIGSGVFSWQRQGIAVLFSSKSSYTLHTTAGKEMDELYPSESFWAGFLSGMGMPYFYTQDWKSLHNQIIAISGQYLRNLSLDEIETLFRDNFIIMDGEAAETLADRGLGHLAGIQSIRRSPENSGECSYEEAVSKERDYAVPRMSAYGLGELVFIGYTEDIYEASFLMKPNHEKAAPGLAIKPGCAMVLPYICKGYSPSLFNSLRLRLFKRELANGSKGFNGLPLMIEEGTNTGAYMFSGNQGDSFALFLVNASSDPVSQIHLKGSLCTKVWHGAAFITETKRDCKIVQDAENGAVTLILDLGPMECALIRW